MSSARRGLLLGLAAAVSFGISAPFAKRLLDDVSPQLLAGLLYLGAFVVLGAFVPARRRRGEAPLRRADLPRLALLVLCGGVLAPVLLLVGLERVDGATGSLLLNLEGPFTLVLALVVFHEHLGRRPAFGGAAIFAGALVLAGGGAPGTRDAIGALCIAGACALWAIDNNLTQALTVRDPFALVTVKAGVAAVVNIGVAVVLGAHGPPAIAIAGALALGAVSYGASVVLDAYALRLLGAAREAAVFATAPFVGALLAIPVLSERFGARTVGAGVVMAIGVVLMLTERHVHLHTHEPFVHDHVHVHDEHHQHQHAPEIDLTTPHSHVHEHGRLTHEHPHVSDVHHRHSH